MTKATTEQMDEVNALLKEAQAAQKEAEGYVQRAAYAQSRYQTAMIGLRIACDVGPRASLKPDGSGEWHEVVTPGR